MGKTIRELFPDSSDAPPLPVRTDQDVRTSVVVREGPQAVAEIPVARVLAPLPFGFLRGPAGTGKTWLARSIVQQRSDAILLATTGIAAVNLGDATTINS